MATIRIRKFIDNNRQVTTDIRGAVLHAHHEEDRPKKWLNRGLTVSGFAFMVGFATTVFGSFVGLDIVTTVGAWVTWGSVAPLTVTGIIRFALRVKN